MSYSRQNPSPRFVQLIEQYRSMHRHGNPVKGIAAKDMFAGESLPRQAGRIKALIARTGARTILDYGSGKGVQYLARQVTENGVPRWDSIQEYWGVSSIRCYDPGYEPIATPPQGKFDGVVCTDVLEHCPEEDLAWMVEELFAFADRFVFANVACFPALKTLPNGENAHCTIRPVDYWCALFEATASRFAGLAWDLWADVQHGSAFAEARCGSLAPRR